MRKFVMAAIATAALGTLGLAAPASAAETRAAPGISVPGRGVEPRMSVIEPSMVLGGLMRTAAGSEVYSAPIEVKDLTNNASDKVFGLAVNNNSTNIAAAITQ